MQITQEKVDNLNSVVRIKLVPADYEERVDKVLRDYKKKVKLPGFREGHVPMSMVKKMVGKNALLEELNKVLSENLYKYISDNKLDVLGNPLPKTEDEEKIDWDKDTDFEFRYDLGLAPNFSIDVLSKLKMERYTIKVDDKLITKSITDVAKRYGKMSNPETTAEGDLIFGLFEELSNGAPKEEGITNSATLAIDNIEDKKLKKQLIGIKVGNSVEFKPSKVFKSTTNIAALLAITPEQADKLKSEFKFTVNRINRMEPTEVNQELFDKIYGSGKVKGEAEFKNKVKEELQKSFEIEADRKFKLDTVETIIKKLKLSLPDEFLKRWLVTTGSEDRPMTKEDVEKNYDNYAKGIRWQLIENKIVIENGIKVNQDEMIDFTKKILKQQLAMYGQDLADDTQLTETAARVLGNRDEAQRIYAQIIDGKLLDLFKSLIKVKEKEVTYDDFVKLASA